MSVLLPVKPEGKYLVLDLEANGFQPDTIWCICTNEYPKNSPRTFLNAGDFKAYIESYDPDLVFIHNGLKYDIPVLDNLVAQGIIPKHKVIDTFVCSLLFDYKKFNTHSLKEIGLYLGVHKGDYTGGFDSFNEDMVKYCEQDVEVLRAFLPTLWKDLEDPTWIEAIKVEQEMATLCYEMNKNGFTFDFDLACRLLKNVTSDMENLEKGFHVAFPPRLAETKRLKYRKTAPKLDKKGNVVQKGRLFTPVQKAIDEADHYEIKGEELIVYSYKDFNPGSGIDKMDALWDAGWKPFDKTKGYITLERKLRQEAWTKRRNSY